MRDILRTQSNMELFEKKVDFIQSLTIFAKTSVLGVSQGYEYASDNTKQKPGALPFISQKIRTAVPVQTHHNNFKLILSKVFDECEEIQSKIHSCILTLLQ